MSTVDTLATAVHNLAIQGALTNQLIASMAETQKELVKAIVDGNTRHDKSDGKMVSLMERQERHREEVAAMRKEIKATEKQIITIEKGVLLNKTKIKTHWLMMGGAVSIAAAVFGFAYILFVKILGTTTP